MKFSYKRYQVSPSPSAPSGVVLRPVVSIRVIGTSGDLFLVANVDPGSDDTLLPLSYGLNVGANIDHNKTWQIEAIGGHRLDVCAGEVEFEMSDSQQTLRWQALVGFVDFTDPADETTVLGHAGFLDYFRITFDGHAKELELEAAPSFTGTS